MNETQSYKNKILFYLLVLISAISFYWLCYHTERKNFSQVFALYTLLFVAYYFLTRFFSFTNFKNLFVAGMFFRMLLLFSIPNLSDDVYRFIWDGEQEQHAEKHSCNK